MHCLALSLILIVLGGDSVESYPTFKQSIPNGNKVPHPCNRSTTWSGVGHEDYRGAGPFNPFGRDFSANGNTWTQALCRLDSDGDGKTNGEELGDPTCVWVASATGPTVTDVTKLSHPGVCEPLDSPNCVGKNKFLAATSFCPSQISQPQAHWCPDILQPDVKSISLKFDQTILPAQETLYYCQQFNVPADEDYHIIAYEPIIANRQIMHHLELFICDTPEQHMALETSGAYKKPGACPMVPAECQAVTIGWAFGLSNRCYNRNTGVKMGKSSYSKVIVQIHYNNPELIRNLSDSSGIKLYYTAKKRQYDVCGIELGQYDFGIPPAPRVTAQTSTTSPNNSQANLTWIVATAFNTSECSYKQLAPYPSYNISAVFIHMHKLGSYAKVLLKKRNGTIITMVNEAVSYDRPKQLIFPEDQPIVIEPGDNFQVACGFRQAQDWTFFGEKTSDEMCIAYFDVHPQPQNQNSLEWGNFGLYDACSIEDMTDTDCNFTDFVNLLVKLETSSTGGLMTFCNDPELGFPAIACTYTCYSFLASNNFLKDPCMDPVMFRASAQDVIENSGDLYRISSQVQKCRALTKPPKMSNKDKFIAESVKAMREMENSNWAALCNMMKK